MKLKLGEVIPLTESQISYNTLAEIKIKDVFQKEQGEVLIERLNDAVNDFYKFRDFDIPLPLTRKEFIQVADFELLLLSAQRGDNIENLHDFSGTISAKLKLEIYETSSKRIVDGNRINLVEIYTKAFNFDIILNDNDYIEYIDISNLSLIQDSLWDDDDLSF